VNLKPYILMIFLLCSSLSGVATAEDHETKNGFSLDDAVSEIREQTGGRILSAKTTDNNGKRIHQIRVLNKDGSVQRFRVKANRKGKQASRKGKRASRKGRH